MTIIRTSVNQKCKEAQKKYEIEVTDLTAVDVKPVDLVTSTNNVVDYRSADDNISYTEGPLQEWNFREFALQVTGSLSGIILSFGCSLLSAWAIADLTLRYQSEVDGRWNDNGNGFFNQNRVIAIVVMSWYLGAAFGGILGSYLITRVPKRVIYVSPVMRNSNSNHRNVKFSSQTLASIMMVCIGIMLQSNSPTLCAWNRFVIGLIQSLVQATLIVQAAESTTKKVRRWMLVTVSYTCAVAALTSSFLFYFFDDRITVTYDEDVQALSIISYILIGLAVLAQLATYLTTETMSYLLRHGNDTEALTVLKRLKCNHLTTAEIRCEYERMKLEVTQDELNGRIGLRAEANRAPLGSMLGIRVLHLLFTNIPITLVLIGAVLPLSQNDDSNNNGTTAATPTDSLPDQNEDTSVPMVILITYQIFRIIFSVLFLIKPSKYHFNRYCYRVTFCCGAAIIFWLFVLVSFGQCTISKIFYYPVMIFFVLGYIGSPLSLQMIELSQTADSYARIKNPWTLALAILVENSFHMFLISQSNTIFQLSISLVTTAFGMMFVSRWLLKNMPNVVAVRPITRMDYELNVHM